MIELYLDDNLERLDALIAKEVKVELVYADCIYESTDYSWLVKTFSLLKPNAILIVQTDYHTVADYKFLLDKHLVFVNWLIYKQEWGGVPRNKFAQKHDDILVYANGENWTWMPERIQIPKATAGTKLDKKGTGLKTPCSVFDDLGNFSTLDKERVKDYNGRNIQWQKPLKLMDRILLPFTNEGDTILDPFLGSGTTAIWSLLNNRNFIGIEKEVDIFKLARQRIEDHGLV